MKIKFIIFVLGVFALSSCANTDPTQTSSMQLCYNVLNFPRHVQGASFLEELASRGEDCSNFLHLRVPSSDSQDIEVNVQQ